MLPKTFVAIQFDRFRDHEVSFPHFRICAPKVWRTCSLNQFWPTSGTAAVFGVSTEHLLVHCAEWECVPLFSEMKVLGRSRDTVTCELLEAFYIKKKGAKSVTQMLVCLLVSEFRAQFMISLCDLSHSMCAQVCLWYTELLFMFSCFF